MLKNGKEECTCTNIGCPRHGKCDECGEHHRSKADNPLPFCQRPQNGQQSGK